MPCPVTLSGLAGHCFSIVLCQCLSASMNRTALINEAHGPHGLNTLAAAIVAVAIRPRTARDTPTSYWGIDGPPPVRSVKLLLCQTSCRRSTGQSPPLGFPSAPGNPFCIASRLHVGIAERERERERERESCASPAGSA
jgi:hypothetical protein